MTVMCKLSDMWYWSLGNELGQKQGHRDHEGVDYGRTKKAQCQACSALQRECRLRRHLPLVNLMMGHRGSQEVEGITPTKCTIAYTFAPLNPEDQHHHTHFIARAMEDPRLSTSLLKNSRLGSE